MTKCISGLSEDYMNFCTIFDKEDTLYAVSEFFLSWMNPNLILKSLMIFFLCLPFILLRGIPKLESYVYLKRYGRMKFEVLNFIHRISFGICLSIILSVYFKQNRPCFCTDDGTNFYNLGSTLYGRKYSIFFKW